METVLIILMGVSAGVLAGMLGVGGGVIFVSALVLFFGLEQVEAVATSLLAIVPVALVGVLRQRAYGNLRLREGMMLGTLAIGGAGIGVVIANQVSGQVLRWGFALLLLVIAWQMLMRAVRR